MAKNKAKMNKFVTGAVTATMVATAVVPVAAAAETDTSFTDVSATDRPDVDRAVDLGFFKNAEKFNPYSNITRGQVAKTLARYVAKEAGLTEAGYFEKYDLGNTVEPFSDVPATHRDNELYVSSLIVKHAEVFTGSNNELMQAKNINRAQMASVLVRAFGLEDLEGDLSKVVDADNVSPSHKANIHILSENGVTTETNYRPFESVKRVQMAKFLNRSYDTVNPEVVEVKIVSVDAIKANQLKVEFNTAVDVDNADVKVSRGNSSVTGSVKWENDNKTAVFTTDANMISGTYNVEVTVAVEGQDSIVVKGSTEVVARYVDKIVVLNGVALTGDSAVGKNNDTAYVYYDVLDQYGDSIRNTTNITWTSSVGGDVTSKANRNSGEIKLTRDNQQFVFGEKIFISGVDTKTGKSVQAELTVGQPRALDQIEIAGFVKKGTSEVLKELPAGFKEGTYYMVFTAVDQNGNEYSSAINEKDLTFVSDNPLLISEIKHDLVGTDVKTLVVDGVEYGAVFVQPGMNVDRGGEANIMAISSKTGKQTVLNVKIGDSTILSKLELLAPAGVTAEGERIEIPFQAVDQHGDPVTNFNVLAKQSQLNALSFNAGNQGNLKLVEQNDGTAKLYFEQTAVNWNEAQATDGVNRPVSLTSIVTGGNASTLMLSISDKARPEAIKEVNMDNVVVERGELEFDITNSASTTSFVFVDQYGRTMTAANAHAFFNASNTYAAGNDFIGYDFSVRATYKGDDAVFTGVLNNKEYEIKPGSGATLTADEAFGVTTAKSGMALQFDIVKYKHSGQTFDNDALSVSPKKSEAVTVVDITAVKNFVVKEVPKLYLETSQSYAPTGEGLVANDPVTGSIKNPKKVSVTGTYNSQTVAIPAAYYNLLSNGLTFTSNEVTGIQAYVSADLAVPADPGVKQVVTATVATVTIAEDDVIDVVVTWGAENVAETVTVSTEADANAIAGAIRTKLSANDEIIAFFNVGGADDKVILTAKDAAANDTNMEIEITNDGAGTTIDGPITSTITTDGEAPTPAEESVAQKGFNWSNLYDVTTAKNLRKDASTSVRAEIKNLDAVGTPVIDTANRTVTLADAAPVATTIVGPEKLTVQPSKTIIDVAAIENTVLALTGKNYEVKDQYNENFTATKLYRVSDVKENADGYAPNNFKISQNDTGSLAIEGAERGDTFTLVIRAEGASLTVEVTVGADTNSTITNGTNNYLNTLVPVLEIQRKASLQ